MEFDDAWRKYVPKINGAESMKQEDLIEIVMNKLKEHPFVQNYPEEAVRVARFRIRLLNLI